MDQSCFLSFGDECHLGRQVAERRRDDESHDLLWPAGMGGQLGFVGADRQTPFNLSCGIFTALYGTLRGEKDRSSDETLLDSYEREARTFGSLVRYA